MSRDFTYIDDVVEIIYRIFRKKPAKPNINFNRLDPDPASSYLPFRIFNGKK